MRLVGNGVLERASRVTLDGDGSDGRAARALLERAALLAQRDRLMVELALRRVSHRRIAEVMKLGPGSVTRRLQRLSGRLHDPLVIALLDARCPLEPQTRQVAVERLLVGLTEAELAARHELTRREVKRQLQYVVGWGRGLREGR